MINPAELLKRLAPPVISGSRATSAALLTLALILGGCGGPIWESSSRKSGDQRVITQPPQPTVQPTPKPTVEVPVTPRRPTATSGSSPLIKDGSIQPSQPGTNTPVTPEATAGVPALSSSSAPTLSPEQYLSQAANSAPPARQDLELKAASALIARGQTGEASRLLSTLNLQSLPVDFHFRRQLLFVEIEQVRGAHERALTVLAPLSRQRAASPEISAEIHRLRATSQMALRQYLPAVASLAARGVLLVDQTELSNNSENIWNLLRLIDGNSLGSARAQIKDPELAAWLELGEIRARLGANPPQLARAVNDWQSRYPGHPGIAFVGDLPAVGTQTGSGVTLTAQGNYEGSEQSYATTSINLNSGTGVVRQIALLLPMGSSFSKQARAVHDGFMAMHNINSQPGRPQVVLYDIGSDPGLVASFYQNAVNEGADFVVGPLGRSAVNALVQSGQLSVPTLLLGVSDYIGSVTGPVYQYGLKPEDELAAVAERAARDGHRVAAIITPEGDFGQRMQMASVDAWRSVGGNIGSVVTYEDSQQGYASAVKRLLEVDASARREARISAIIGKNVKFEPRRRKDIDVVLMIARNKTGRLLKPQLDFHQGHNLAVYSTSAIYGGKPDPVNDADLDGIVFPEMPWLVTPTASIAALRQKVAANRRPSNLDRLFAFGMDAYSIVPNLDALASNPQARFDGVTARLRVGNNNQVHRDMTWVRFRNGSPTVVPASAAPASNSAQN